MDGKIQKIDKKRHMDDSAADAEKTRHISDKDAQTDPEPRIEFIIERRPVRFGDMPL
jgi:hypothetical protein